MGVEMPASRSAIASARLISEIASAPAASTVFATGTRPNP
jgi:hypothetical protein